MDALILVLLWVVIIGLWIAWFRLSGKSPVAFIRSILGSIIGPGRWSGRGGRQPPRRRAALVGSRAAPTAAKTRGASHAQRRWARSAPLAALLLALRWVVSIALSIAWCRLGGKSPVAFVRAVLGSIIGPGR